MKRLLFGTTLLVLAMLCPGSHAAGEPMDSSFVYQGSLDDNGAPANGNYDFQFGLFDDDIGGSQIGATQSANGIPVVGGLFTVPINFGTAGTFVGDKRWLEIRVAPAASGAGPFTTLDPRRELKASPNAIYSTFTDSISSLDASDGSPADVVSVDADGAVAFTQYGNRIYLGSPMKYLTIPPRLVDPVQLTVPGVETFIAGTAFGSTFDPVLRQSATATSNTTLSRIHIRTFAPSPDTVNVRIYQGAGVSGTLLHEEFIAIPSGDNFVQIFLNEGVAISAGGTYTIEVDDQSGAATFAANSGNPYAGGTAFDIAGTALPDVDMYFQLYGIPSTNTVSIGSPSLPFQVSASLSSDPIAKFVNTDTGATADVVEISIGRIANPNTNNNFITFRNGSASVGAIEGNGSASIVLSGSGADYAEFLQKTDSTEMMEPGDVVGVYSGQISRRTAGADAVMVISTAPIVQGNDPGEENRAGWERVAFVGQAPVRVRGNVRAGDLLVASGLDDGTAIAAPGRLAPGMKVLGVAWQDGSADNGEELLVMAAIGATASQAAIDALASHLQSVEERLERLESDRSPTLSAR